MDSLTRTDKSTSRRILLESKRTIEPKKKRFSSFKQVLRFFTIFDVRRLFPRKLFRSKKRTAFTIGITVLLITLGAAFAGYEYILQNNPSIVYSRKINTMTSQVSKYVPVPQDEQPVVATVTDTAKLPHETFFSYAKNGDKILMYKKNKKAILFRPSTGQVITEATLDFRNAAPSNPNQTAVAGASTSASFGTTQDKSSVQGTSAQPTGSISPAPTNAVTDKTFHPDGKILIAPQQ